MLRRSLAILVFFLSITSSATEQTLRVDFFHTGNVDIELFSLDQVVLEPLPFPGNLLQPVDVLLRGKYMF